MTILYIIGILAAILLILVILIQNPKGGGLASNFSSSNSVLGVAKTTELIEKATWGLAAVILVVALVVTMSSSAPTPGATAEPEKSILDGASTVPTPTAPQGAQQAPGQGQQGGGAVQVDPNGNADQNVDPNE